LEKLLREQQIKRKSLSDEQNELKRNKLLEYDIKMKELDWLSSFYQEGEELEKIRSKNTHLELDLQEWLIKFEHECIKQEKILDDNEQEDDFKLERIKCYKQLKCYIFHNCVN
jgi:hypothetical protein